MSWVYGSHPTYLHVPSSSWAWKQFIILFLLCCYCDHNYDDCYHPTLMSTLMLFLQVDHAAIHTVCACGNVYSDFTQSRSAVLPLSRRRSSGAKAIWGNWNDMIRQQCSFLGLPGWKLKLSSVSLIGWISDTCPQGYIDFLCLHAHLIMSLATGINDMCNQ